MKQEANYPCWEGPCSSILPGGTDVCVGRSDCTVQADVTVERVRSVVIWGVVSDCTGTPVANALVKLLRYECGHGEELRELCRTHTDCQGRYQFDLERGCEGRYRIVVSPRACDAVPCPKPPCSNPCTQPWQCCESHGCRSTTRSNVQYY